MSMASATIMIENLPPVVDLAPTATVRRGLDVHRAGVVHRPRVRRDLHRRRSITATVPATSGYRSIPIKRST